MKRVLFIITMVLVFGATTSIGTAYQGQRQKGHAGQGKHSYGNRQMQVPLHRWWKLPQATEQLNLTPEEIKIFDDLYQKVKVQLIDSDALLQKQMLKLEMQFDSENFNQNKCLKIFQDAQSARTKLALDKFEFALKTRDVLGKERFEKLLNTFKQFRSKALKRGIQQRQNKSLKSCPAKGSGNKNVAQ
ncbi:MAG: hypothetical protein GY707_01690 [Desulfobacteraceae bacterium]|nr:hypothetical protein [Desulfobacteraceae bacterium]